MTVFAYVFAASVIFVTIRIVFLPAPLMFYACVFSGRALRIVSRLFRTTSLLTAVIHNWCINTAIRLYDRAGKALRAHG